MAKRGRKKGSRTKSRSSKRRSIKSRVRRGARRAGRRLKKVGKKHGKSIVTVITDFIPPIASIQLLTHNQTSALPANSSMSMKAKAVINGLTGSIFDFNVFDEPGIPKAHVHFDIEGAFNQWSAIAVTTMIGGFIGKKLKIKRAGMLSSVGNKLLLPSIISGSLGLKNNNPASGQRHSPFFNRSGSTNSHSTNSNVITVSNNSPGV